MWMCKRGLFTAARTMIQRLPRALGTKLTTPAHLQIKHISSFQGLFSISSARPSLCMTPLLNVRPSVMLSPSPSCSAFAQQVRPMRSLVGTHRIKRHRGGHRMGAAHAQPRKRSTSEKRKQNFKLKTHHGAAKRFKLRGSGKWVFTATGKKHLQAGMSRSRQTRRKLQKRVIVTKGLIKKLFKLMPYHKRRALRRA